MTTQKLELTWIGKDKTIVPEPRILLESGDLSYGDRDSGNILIHGDNLLALKSLEQEFAGRVRCIYIDPPYNTGSAFEHYDDGQEHSIWLSLMRTRIELLWTLLRTDGMIFVQIDNRELHYLKVLMDEVFGRINYRNSIIVKKGVKNVSVQFDTVERLNAGYDTILMYSKEQSLRIPNLFGKADKNDVKGSWNNHWRGTDRPTMRYELLGVTPEKGQWRWAKDRTYKAVENYKIFEAYLAEQGVDPLDQSSLDKAYGSYLKKNGIADVLDFQLVRLSKNGKPEHYIPPSDKILLSENWLDLSVAGRQTDFEHEKNEFILQRIIEWITNPGDVVLDSFLGSGTTAAVAHKMGRRWIGIELGDHAYTHCKVRMDKIIDGEQGGISKAVGWQGGGGYRFYELAPSIINVDKYGMPVISKEYNAEMLAAAMAKHEDYAYAPDENVVWKQGHYGEKNFIFTMTGTLTADYLDGIAAELGEDEYLLICAASFEPACKKRHKRITVQKIPQILLGRCEYGKTDYNLNVIEEVATFEEDFSDEE